MNVLDKIVAAKRKRLALLKKQSPLNLLIAESERAPRPPSFREAVARPGRLAIIAEMKKASPSAGVIVKNYRPAEIAGIYEKAGAAAVSVLTEEDYFAGDPRHVSRVRKEAGIPVLRKDFIVDPWQVYETRILGASALLLIIAILDKKTYSNLIRLAAENGLDALVEVHSEEELKAALAESPTLVGINNRNLKDLTVDVGMTFRLLDRIPKGVAVVAESGIQSPETVRDLKAKGVTAALIGESILKSKNMRKTLKDFVDAGAPRGF